MILQALCKYYERMVNDPSIQVAEVGFSREKIHAEIVLNESGDLLQFNDLRVEGRSKPVPRSLTVPQSRRRPGSKPYEKPFFLWDNTGFVLGKDTKNDAKTKVKKSLASGYPRPEAVAFPPDSWLRHRDFNSTVQAEPNDSDHVQSTWVFTMH